MQRFHQLLFSISLVTLSWLAMMAVHEVGHVLGALATGGSIDRVTLHPLRISRTDVNPNPHPGVVVWLGPIAGCFLPMAAIFMTPKRAIMPRAILRFFAGFCLIANGAYIAIGSMFRVGDCGEMLRTGTPPWVMLAFGAVTVPLGLYMWHTLGSLTRFLKDPSLASPRAAYFLFAVLIVVVFLELAIFSP
ncbi:MAG: hypothetical protein ACQESR_12650 [Planctomycetota bacterium]